MTTEEDIVRIIGNTLKIKKENTKNKLNKKQIEKKSYHFALSSSFFGFVNKNNHLIHSLIYGKDLSN